jgi:Flp pilus assembly protein TadD
MIKNLAKNIILFLSITTIFPFFAYSQDEGGEYIRTNDVIKEIEKSLLFDKRSKEKIDFYYNQNSKRKSDFTIGNSENNIHSDSRSKVDIFIFEPKEGGINNKEKEKLAYNAVLVSQYEVAIDLYKQILKSEPNNQYAKFSLAAVYQKIGQYNQAQLIYRELLKSDPVNKEEIINNLLAILIENSPRESVYLLNRLVLQNPDSPEVLAQSAIAYDKIEDYEKAITNLEKAVHLDPQNLVYKYNLAIIYDKASKYENALSFYRAVEKEYNTSNSDLISIEHVRGRIEFIKSNKI